jgi:AraC-like DNA-binding protein
MSIPIISESFKDRVSMHDSCRERFITQQQIAGLHEQEIHMAGLADMREQYLVERKGPSMHTLLFTVQGEGVLETLDETQPLLASSLAVLPAGKPFRFSIGQHCKHWQMAWLLLDVKKLWLGSPLNEQKVVASEYAESVWALLSLMIAAHCNPVKQGVWLNELAASLESALLLGAGQNTAQQRVKSAFEQASLQLHQRWSVKDIATMSYLSEAHLNRITIKLFNRSAYQHLLFLRMEKAKELLRHSQWGLAIIATHLGYCDAYSFSKSFSQAVGCSPKAFRFQKIG